MLQCTRLVDGATQRVHPMLDADAVPAAGAYIIEKRPGAAAAKWMFLSRIAAPPRLPRECFSHESRRGRGRRVDISLMNRGAAAAPT